MDQICVNDSQKGCCENSCQKQEKPLKICKKCKENPPVFMLGPDPTCKHCFLTYIEHTFKSTIKMKCNVNPKNAAQTEKILICASTGMNSAVLLKVFSDCIYQTGLLNKNKMFITAEVLHIDESILWSHFGFQTQRIEEQLSSYSENLKLKYNVRGLESIYQNPQNLLDLVDSLPDYGSSREDIIAFLKYHIILKFASENGFKKIALAVNGQKIAAKVLSTISKGRGIMLNKEIQYESKIQYKLQFEEEKQIESNISEFTFIRPLRDILDKSIVYYAHLQKINEHFSFNLEQHICSKVNTNKPGQGNIDHLLENFVNKLQNGFSSTVFTVLQTAGKTDVEINDNGRFCPLCLNNEDKVMNLLETQTLDQSSQDHQTHLLKKTKYFKVICFSCRRLLQKFKIQFKNIQSLNSKFSEQYFNLSSNLFPQQIRNIANDQMKILNS